MSKWCNNGHEVEDVEPIDTRGLCLFHGMEEDRNSLPAQVVARKRCDRCTKPLPVLAARMDSIEPSDTDVTILTVIVFGACANHPQQ